MEPRVPKHPAGNGSVIRPGDLSRFQRALLSWFERHRRDLPWRRTRDPYRIWVSEIMLQQTRVAAAIPYYQRFVARFPSPRHLARAPISSVLAIWSGLGYYARARNLYRAAKAVLARHSGHFPRTLQAALALPGIGNYTAAAILSIAYGEPLAALDGNAVRVLCRLAALRADPREITARRKLQQLASALLPPSAPGDWNQAVMELGATVCAPVSPACPRCPVKRWCRAHQLGIAETLPLPGRKPRAARITVAAAVFLDSRARTLLVRHRDQQGALFSGLWQFPAAHAPATSPRTPLQLLGAALKRMQPAAGGLATAAIALPVARHTVTFRSIRLHPFLIRVSKLPPVSGARTPALASLHRGGLPVSNATRKIAAAALDAWLGANRPGAGPRADQAGMVRSGRRRPVACLAAARLAGRDEAWFEC